MKQPSPAKAEGPLDFVREHVAEIAKSINTGSRHGCHPSQANFMWEVQLPNNSWSAYSPEISGSLNNTLEAGLRPGSAHSCGHRRVHELLAHV